jgi:hypothetical protein
MNLSCLFVTNILECTDAGFALRVVFWSSQRRRQTFCCIFYVSFSEALGSFREGHEEILFGFHFCTKSRQSLCLLFISGPRKVDKPTVHCFVCILYQTDAGAAILSLTRLQKSSQHCGVSRLFCCQ